MIDLSKYGATPIEGESNIQQNGLIDVSKYGATSAVPTPKKQEPQGVGGAKGFALGAVKSFIGSSRDLAGQIQGLGKGALGLAGVNTSKLGIDALDNKTAVGSQIEQQLQRRGTAEKLGGYAETAAEFIIPSLMAKKAYKSAKTIDYLKNTPETLTPLEEKAANLAGRVKTSITGSKKILPSETEKRAAQILKGKVSGNFTKNPTIIDKEIAKRGAEVENFLAKNSKKVTAKEQAEMFSKARKAMEKYATKAELKAYDEQMKTFTKQIVGRGGFNTDTFYRALKDFEQNVTRNLPKGKSALLGDSQGIGSARIRAAQDVRKVVRDMLGQKHPEFKGKMFDLASLYDVLDTALVKSRQLSGNALSRFAQNNPTLTNIAKVGAGVAIGKTLLGGKEQNLSNINQLGN